MARDPRHIERLPGILGAAAVLAFWASGTALHASSVEQARIVRLAVRTDGIAFVAVSRSKTANPQCSANGEWHYTFSTTTPAGAAVLATAITAKSTGAYVRVYGQDNCTVYPGIEDLWYVDL